MCSPQNYFVRQWWNCVPKVVALIVPVRIILTHTEGFWIELISINHVVLECHDHKEKG